MSNTIELNEEQVKEAHKAIKQHNGDNFEIVKHNRYEVETNFSDTAFIKTPDEKIFVFYHGEAEAIIDALQNELMPAWEVEEIINDITGYEPLSIAC